MLNQIIELKNLFFIKIYLLIKSHEKKFSLNSVPSLIRTIWERKKDVRINDNSYIKKFQKNTNYRFKF